MRVGLPRASFDFTLTHPPTMARALRPLVLVALFAACKAEPRSARGPAAPSPEALRWIEEGRTLLDQERPAEAEALFARAVADSESLETRTWLLRSWMDQGRSNDTLDALDALDKAGEKGPDMTYLYGMAFARRAEGLIADGVTDSSIQLNFIDAADLLKQALDADGTRYRDAYAALARSAWFNQDLATARWAADQAVIAYPANAEAWLTRGRVAMSQFVTAQGEGAPEADALWQDATTSLERSVELFGTPSAPAKAASLSAAATELGHAYLWKQAAARATEAYAIAMAWGPDSFDFGQVQGLLRGAAKDPEGRPTGFRAALEDGYARLVERTPAMDAKAAALCWWLGWARFVDADWDGCEQAFQRALELEPTLANSWFYIALARQYRKDSEGALAAMHAGWDSEPAAIVAVASASGGSLRAFENLTGWCADNDKNLEGAFLSEILTQAFPDEPRHWNNLGLFLRDEGERLEIEAYKNKTPEPDPALLDDLYGRALKAYERALELHPDDPQLINDTALMLHYHFETDKAEVEAMYHRAIELLEAQLASSDLSEDDRARFETTKKDVAKNLEWLLDPEKAKRDAEEAAAKEAAAEAEAKAHPEATDEAAPEPEAKTEPEGG